MRHGRGRRRRRPSGLAGASVEHRVDAIASHVGEDPVRVPVRREPDGVPDVPRGLRIDAIVVAGDDGVEDPAARVGRLGVQVAVGASCGLVVVAFGSIVFVGPPSASACPARR